MIAKSLRSIFVAVMMGASAYCGSLIFQCLQMWLAFVSPKAFRWYIDITMFMWICSSIVGDIFAGIASITTIIVDSR